MIHLSDSQIKEFGWFLKRQRVKAGLTQAEASKRLKLTTNQYISNIERGKYLPSIKHLRRLINIYNIHRPTIKNLVSEYYEKAAKEALHGSK